MSDDSARCAGCGELIREGELVHDLDNGEYLHAGCDKPLEFTADGLLVVDCAKCRGTGEFGVPPGDRDWCPECGGSGDDFFDPFPLIRNLAIGGALCRAFGLGDVYGVGLGDWRPGCQRSAS